MGKVGDPDAERITGAPRRPGIALDVEWVCVRGGTAVRRRTDLRPGTRRSCARIGASARDPRHGAWGWGRVERTGRGRPAAAPRPDPRIAGAGDGRPRDDAVRPGRSRGRGREHGGGREAVRVRSIVSAPDGISARAPSRPAGAGDGGAPSGERGGTGAACEERTDPAGEGGTGRIRPGGSHSGRQGRDRRSTRRRERRAAARPWHGG